MSERVACSACGKWMFHLAASCPHCGAPAKAESAGPAKKLELSAEEARALLAATPSAGRKTVNFGDVAAELVLSRGGAAEVVLSVLAAPVTITTVMVLGYLLMKQKQHERDEKLAGVRLLAVPACTALMGVSLIGTGVPLAGWLALGASFTAWVVRELARARERRDPLA